MNNKPNKRSLGCFIILLIIILVPYSIYLYLSYQEDETIIVVPIVGTLMICVYYATYFLYKK